MTTQVCFRCRKVRVPLRGERCGPCMALPDDAPAPVEKTRAPRGPTPDAFKMLRTHIRDLRTMQVRLRKKIYATDSMGALANVDYSEQLAGQLVELGREVTSASKEMRQWEDLVKQRAAKKKIPDLVEDAIGFLCCDKVTNDLRREAIQRLVDTIGEPVSLKAVP